MTAFYDDAAPVIAAFRWEPNGSAELERLGVENDLLKVGQPRGCLAHPSPMRANAGEVEAARPARLKITRWAEEWSASPSKLLWDRRRSSVGGARNVSSGEGFRAPALCDGGTGPGAGARKPPKEETAGRYWDRLASAPMGI